jgi:hypothetical protein
VVTKYSPLVFVPPVCALAGGAANLPHISAISAALANLNLMLIV